MFFIKIIMLIIYVLNRWLITSWRQRQSRHSQVLRQQNKQPIDKATKHIRLTYCRKLKGRTKDLRQFHTTAATTTARHTSLFIVVSFTPSLLDIQVRNARVNYVPQYQGIVYWSSRSAQKSTKCFTNAHLKMFLQSVSVFVLFDERRFNHWRQ